MVRRHTHTHKYSQYVLQNIAKKIIISSFFRFTSFLTFYQLIRCPLPFHLMPFAACLAPSRQSISHFICYCSVRRSLSVICLPGVPFGGLESGNEKKGGPGFTEGHCSSGGVGLLSSFNLRLYKNWGQSSEADFDLAIAVAV